MSLLLAIPYYLSGAWMNGLRLWAALPGPVKAAILIVLAAAVGVLWGEHDGNRRCQARINASIEAARSLDGSISAETKARADQQTAAAEAREKAIREEVTKYADELAQKTAAACADPGLAGRYNDGLGVSDDAVQPSGQEPAVRRGRGPVTVPLPPRKGQ